jgi:hypothetical protein
VTNKTDETDDRIGALVAQPKRAWRLALLSRGIHPSGMKRRIFCPALALSYACAIVADNTRRGDPDSCHLYRELEQIRLFSQAPRKGGRSIAARAMVSYSTFNATSRRG